MWRFPKETGQLGVFNAAPTPLGVEDTLVREYLGKSIMRTQKKMSHN